MHRHGMPMGWPLALGRWPHIVVSVLVVWFILPPLMCVAEPVEEVAGDSVADTSVDSDRAHLELMVKDRFPSAKACGACHVNHYREWSISQHAYAQMSPVFNAMQGTIGKLTNGTLGDFCIRCHTPVGMTLEEDEFMSNIDRHPTSREGVTCVVCHRVNQDYGKITGRIALEEGSVTEPVYGPTGRNSVLYGAVKEHGLVTEEGKSGTKVHQQVKLFAPIRSSAFCGSCHDVTEINGFRLEEAFSEWKSSPAAKKGINCQDCHMGKEPGKVLAEKSDPDFHKKNYPFGPAARVNGVDTTPRKLTNHMFVGPDYSLLPASLYPQHVRAFREEGEKDDAGARGLATIREWLTFKIDAGWGTAAFEDSVEEDYEFPERWVLAEDRIAARAIIDANQALLAMVEGERLKLLRNGYKLGDVVVTKADEKGIRFEVEVRSGTNGHNVPTGFDGERVVWLFIQVRDAEGAVVFESGDLDPNGDVRDLHSAYVHNHELPLDKYLFSLQSRFLTFATRGAEREQVIAVPYSLTVVPFLNPERRSAVLLGRHFGARKHRKGIEPGGHRWAKYRVDKKLLTGRGPYTATIQLKAAPIPVNLVNATRRVGFDYGLSARDIADALVKGHQVIWERRVDLVVGGAGSE